MTRRLPLHPPQRLRRRARRVRAAQRRARGASCSAAGWSSPALLALAAFGGLFARFCLPAGGPARALPDARRDQPHRDRADRAQPRRDHRPQRRRARAKLLGVHARAHAGEDQEPRGDDRRARRDRRHPAARPQALPQAPRRVEELREHAAAHAPDRRGGRALRRATATAFPGVEIKARLFRQYPFGEVASHVVGYIGRINDKDLERIADVGRDGELQGLRLHRQGRRRALLRARAARHDGRGGSRGRRRRPRGAHAVAHAAGVRQQPARCRSTSSCRKSAESRVRRPPRRAGRDRSAQRATSSRSCRKPGYDPNLFVDGIDPANWERSTSRRTSRCSTVRCAARIRRARRSSRSWRSARSRPASARRRRRSSIPGYLPASRARRTASATTSRAATARSTCTSRSSCRATRTTTCSRARPTSTTPRASCRSSASAARPASTSRASCPASCRRANGSGSASPARSTARSTASGISATRSPPASGRATTRSRRCSSPTRSRSIANDGVAYPAAPRQERSQNLKTGEERSVAPQPTHTIAVKPEHIAIIKNALVGVNKEGTSAAAFAGAQFTSAAARPARRRCTRSRARSTSRSKVDERLRDHAWFIAYAPADKPKIALAVLVENGGFGAQAAAPIARKVLDYYLLGDERAGAGARRAGAPAGEDESD